MYKVGDTASITKSFSSGDVQSFAKISGDNNPIHLDEEFASTTQFGKRLVHGILTSGLISALLGMTLPGPGSVYLKQILNFRAPVYLGDVITAEVELTHVREDKPILTLETICKNQDGVIVIDGEAILLAPSKL